MSLTASEAREQTNKLRAKQCQKLYKLLQKHIRKQTKKRDDVFEIQSEDLPKYPEVVQMFKAEGYTYTTKSERYTEYGVLSWAHTQAVD